MTTAHANPRSDPDAAAAEAEARSASQHTDREQTRSAGEHSAAEHLASAEDFARCAAVVRERARNFSYGLRLTPEPRRSSLYAIYAWMRFVDDIADGRQPLAHRRTQLARVRAHIDTLNRTDADDADAPGDAAAWRSMRAAMRRHALPIDELCRVLDALETDLAADAASEERASADAPPPPMFATTAQLETYCDGVASTVGRLCVRVWGVEDARRLDEALDLATRRGRAFQLTNILRDVAADARSGRLYVPADVLAAQDVSPEALLGWREPTSAAGAITALAQRAAEHYRASAPLEGLIRRDARAALWAMTRIYRGVLRRVETEPRLSVAERRAGLSKPRKVAVAAAAVTRAALGL